MKRGRYIIKTHRPHLSHYHFNSPSPPISHVCDKIRVTYIERSLFFFAKASSFKLQWEQDIRDAKKALIVHYDPPFGN